MDNRSSNIYHFSRRSHAATGQKQHPNLGLMKINLLAESYSSSFLSLSIFYIVLALVMVYVDDVNSIGNDIRTVDKKCIKKEERVRHLLGYCP